VKRKPQGTLAFLFLAAASLFAGDQRVHLFPQFQPRQVITYLIRFRSDVNVKTESRVAAPMAPRAAQIDARGLLRVEILDAQQTAGKPAIYARGQFLTLDSGVWVKAPGEKKPDWEKQRVDPNGKTIDFTISEDGSVSNVRGLDSLFPDQQQAWQQWVSRFALAWILPPGGMKPGEKWKSEQPEKASAPLAGLLWALETSYVRDEPCQSSQLSLSGEVSPAGGSPGACAVLLTTAKLKQKSSSKDATPEEYKLHELRTTGTAKGSNEVITYISIQTGLVVRATEEATQFMNVVIATADGSNRVHYDVDARSHSEVLLVTETPQNRP
jgi:hypothetical protein